MEATETSLGTGFASLDDSVPVKQKNEGRNTPSVVPASHSPAPPPPTQTTSNSPTNSPNQDTLTDNRNSPVSRQQLRQNIIIINTEGIKDLTGDQEPWRPYGEHPLTAATAAMLNIQEQPTDMSTLYDYYKIEGLSDIKQDGDHIIWSGPGTVAVNGLTSQLRLTNDGPLGPDLVRVSLLDDQPTELLVSGPCKLEPRGTENLSDGVVSRRVDKAVEMSSGTPVSSNRVDSGRESDFGASVIVNGGLGSNTTPETMMGSVINVSANSGVLLSHGLVKEEPKSPDGLHSHESPSPSHSPILARTISRDLDTSVIVPNSADHAKTLQAAYDFTTAPYDHVTGFGGLNPTSQESLPPATSPAEGTDTIYTLTSSDPYYRDYYTPPGEQYLSIRQQLNYPGSDPHQEGLYVDRFLRHSTGYKANSGGLTVDLPSPDSGIGADAITPRDHNTLQQNVEYQDLVSVNANNQHSLINTDPSLLILPRGNQTGTPGPGRSRPWHDFGRQNEADKVQISKTYSNYGFRYFLESPISTSQRREDDRITYINKGQFYGITMEYIPDPDKPHLKSPTVKSIIMLMFREEKSPEDEIKAWQFWHSRQHSVKQRILDVDTKNSFGLVGCIEEVAHNAIAVYWNPMESVAKVNISVQCLSTDFSSQKGVKGLPLHVQIDTYEDPRDTTVHHRGYCQIKVFCDKGAERKTRDEERRAAKRRLSTTGRKKMEDLYHPPCERSEFYTMTDRAKIPVLFTPSGELEKQLPAIELSTFYGQGDESSSCGAGSRSDLGEVSPSASSQVNGLLSPSSLKSISSSHNLKFHNLFPPPVTGEKRLCSDLTSGSLSQEGLYSPMQKRSKLTNGANNDRLMLYVKQEEDTAYTPLHLVPPSTLGLLTALEVKYRINPSSIRTIYRKNKKGVLAKLDDDMLQHYCNEDTFLLESKVDHDDLRDVILIEQPSQ